MPTLRTATVEDAHLITENRHRMFAANDFAPAERLEAMDERFEPWVRERLQDGRYMGVLLEEEGAVLASAGVFFADFPPHFLHVEAGRPYLTNFYTAPEARGRGYAKVLLKACVEACRERGYPVVSLHASRFGRPIYEAFGFEANNEMVLKLD